MEPTLNKLAETLSPFQKIELFHHEKLGQQLWVDHNLVACESDQPIAEAMLRPMATAPNLKQIMIASSGHGNLVGQLLKTKADINQFTSLSSIKWIELDIEVIRLCQQYPTELNSDLYRQPLLQIIVGDAHSVIKHSDRLDGIIWDIPLPSTVSENTDHINAFFKMLRKHLMPGGWLSISSHSDENIFAALKNEFSLVNVETIKRESTQQKTLIHTAKKASEY
ncbi:MAG: hypothetical protein MI867_13125 [Pseudomonadales bacterium]|nr:hypothetical protein [Pseudomonadales bacterium]